MPRRSSLRRDNRSLRDSFTSNPLFSEDQFRIALSMERRRSERSKKPFLLMRATLSSSKSREGLRQVADRAIQLLSNSIRATDILGWHQDGKVLGVIFTELGSADKDTALSALKTRMAAVLRDHLEGSDSVDIRLSFVWFPDDPAAPEGIELSVYPECERRAQPRKIARAIKRIVDIVGSSLALLSLSWLFLGIALLIRLTSKGPALFRQKRIGLHGRQFTFLKFRSMRVNNDAAIHREYVTQFISGKADLHSNGNGGVFKITQDPRVTAVGRFLRKTSLDELPQLINVLKGNMSLIGPRPPIPYEFESYDLWHRRRVVETRPGITGLWQVSGRSRTSFDEMVRLDLLYSKNWSLWLDFKILLETPRAVLSGDGAY
jgi:lipopolysaccharide/colanic/teichoic acid biosynthesis glycosyltransferase